ncbi:MAG: sigma-70 family RNA polymerase sigma factor [Phycisphaeraceae bacterium]|nr:sigma-70 family RNA polymerase sigma factor [Phycisphaeraceae bacterium]
MLGDAEHQEAGNGLPVEATALYRDLRRLAAGLLNSEQAGHTLQPTALVHEAFLRLVEESSGSAGAMNSLSAMGIAMRVMRHVLVDHARKQKAEKRGGGRARSLEGVDEPGEAESLPLIDILVLNEALDRYEQLDPRGAQVVQLRFFAGMTVAEVATVLGIGISTAEEEWRVARAWLAKELRASE